MSVFGKWVSAGHHRSRSLLQLAQFLTSLIQSYPGACQISDHARSCPFHALDATRAWDVLSQTSRCLSSCYFTNWVQRWKEKTKTLRLCINGRLHTYTYTCIWGFSIHSSSLSSDWAPPPKRPLKNPLLGASGVSTGVKSSPSISCNHNKHLTQQSTILQTV